MSGNPAICTALESATDRVWPEPDLSILECGRRQPPPLPMAPFGKWAGWIEQQGQQCSAPNDYVALGLLTGISTLIGNSRWVSPFGSGWREPPVLWAACVGNPSSGKTPALSPMLSIMEGFEEEAATEFSDTERDHETEKATAKVRRDKWQTEVEDAVKNGTPPPTIPANAIIPDEPECPRLKVNDTTVERLISRMAAQPKGLMLFRDELAGWLGNLDKFGAGDRGFWIEAYNGKGYTQDRVKHGTKSIRVPRLAVSVLGGIQPDRLSSLLMRGDDDGLASRFLMVWPSPVKPVRPLSCQKEEWVDIALRRLNHLGMARDEEGNLCPAYISMSDEAADLFHEWRVQAHERETEASGLFLSHLGKTPGITARLSLLLEYLWWAADPSAPEPTHITQRSVGFAAHLVSEYFVPMAERVYGDAVLPVAERNASVLAKAIMKNGVSEFNAREVKREWRLPGLREAAPLKAALEILEAGDFVIPSPARQGDTPGRSRADYLVNPKLKRRGS